MLQCNVILGCWEQILERIQQLITPILIVDGM